MTKLESLKAFWARTFSPLVSDDERLGVWLENCSVPEITFAMKAAAKRIKKMGAFKSTAHAIRYVEKVFRITFSKTLLPYSPPKPPFVFVNGPGEKCWVDGAGAVRMTRYWPWIDLKDVGDCFWVEKTSAMYKRKTSLRQTLRMDFSKVHRKPKLLALLPWLSFMSCSFTVEDRTVRGVLRVGVLVTRVM
jgi:hypothetical protein